jgi:hypothetical protein
MAIATQGDVVTYSDTGTTKLTSQGVTLMTPGATAALGTSGNPIVTQTSSLQTTADLTTARLAISTATTTAAVTATASQRTRVYRMRVNVSGAQTLTIQSAANTLEIIALPAAAVFIYDFSTRPWYTTNVNEALNVTSSAAVATNIIFEYTKNAL